jgi:hypothetical protein
MEASTLYMHARSRGHVVDIQKNTNSKANLPTPMFWHKVLHQWLSANTFNLIIRLRSSVFAVGAGCGASGARSVQVVHVLQVLHAQCDACMWLTCGGRMCVEVQEMPHVEMRLPAGAQPEAPSWCYLQVGTEWHPVHGTTTRQAELR